MEALKQLMEDKPVVIFSKSNCCMCHSICTLISGFGANPTIYELDKLPNRHMLERALAAVSLSHSESIPAVFIGQQLVGGADEIIRLQVRGKLEPLLKKAQAIWL